MSVDEWDQREVCPDGACIGVIGPDGLCKVCGRAAQNWGDERKRGMRDEPVDESDEHAPAAAYDADEDEELEDDETADEADEDVGDDVEWSKRQLCANGACVGVIGENGKCTVCGASP